MNNPTLSIVVLSYNTKELLDDCLSSLVNVEKEVAFEVLVPDNGSTDGSVELVKKKFPKYYLIEIGENIGFAAGNNRARKYCRGEYVLFLNSDTVVYKNTLRETLKYMKENSSVGALSCRVELANGELDRDTRRSFITPWVGLTHIFLRLDRLFPKSRLFGRYWYGYIPDTKEHEVDVIQGAFFLTRKKILDEVGWFDEDYFLDGEDIDLCWKIKQSGYKIVYLPKVKILHLKGSSKGKVESENKGKVSLSRKIKFRSTGVNSMEIFYRKRLWNKYPFMINIIVIGGIRLLKLFRVMRTLMLG